MAEARRLSRLAAAAAGAAVLPSGSLVVALSGGADSAALAWLAVREGTRVRAVHVHHGWPASDAMAAAAIDVGAAIGIETDQVGVEVEKGASPEARARAARYAALESELRADEWLLTAHTLDDQAETVLDHLLRSSGTDGMRGIPSRRGRIVRPFLGVTRAQTRELATLAGLPWLDDPSNADLDPLRNRIRRRLIPDLEAAYSPNLRAGLARSASLLAMDADHLDGEIAGVPIFAREGALEVGAATVSTAPPALAARLIRHLLSRAGYMAAPPEAVSSVADVAAGRSDRCRPGRGLEVRRRGGMLRIELSPHSVPGSVVMTVPGSTSFGPWRFDAFVGDEPPAAFPLSPAWMVADLDAVGDLGIEPCHLRPQLNRWLAGAGVGAADRGAHPVVVGSGRPLWIPEVRRFDVGWAEPSTDRYLVVRARVEPT